MTSVFCLVLKNNLIRMRLSWKSLLNVFVRTPFILKSKDNKFSRVFFFFFFFFFLGPHLQHVDVSRLGAESELQLLAYAIAMWDLSHICNLHHSPQQCHILNPLSGARDWTPKLLDTSWVHYHWAKMRTPHLAVLKSHEINFLINLPSALLML